MVTANLGLYFQRDRPIQAVFTPQEVRPARTFVIMRHRFNVQPSLNITPIEKIQLPLNSRDELPPILAALQWIFLHPTLHAAIFTLLERHLLANKKPTGRTGLDLWHILVLGVARLGLAADWDRLEHLANYDSLLRQLLGVAETPWATAAKHFHRQTLRDNCALLDEGLLQEINVLIAAHGRGVFKTKSAAAVDPLALKADTYVLETDVHFPTDLNLLWDAVRKCIALIEKFRDQFHYELPGWRKSRDWHRRLKSLERTASHVVFGGGPDKEQRLRAVVRDYLAVARELSAKVDGSLVALCDQPVAEAHWETLAYFHGMLDKHIGLVERRLLRGETIPAAEKVYSLFEPHTEWIVKGKPRPPVELGHRLLITTDQHELIHDYAVAPGVADVDQSVPLADRLLGRYGAGAMASLSFDKGFTRAGDRELIGLYIPQVIMPKRGRKSAAEAEAESAKGFVALRRRHSAVESDIHSLKHHGLNRCLDVGWEGYGWYVGFGVMAYNLHVIGRELLQQERARVETVRAAA
jgi:hypothetical protein